MVGSLLVLLVLVCSSVPLYATDVESCSVEWEADWDDVTNLEDIKFYPSKGEIFTGVTVRDVLQDIGLAWNAPSWQEITGLLCVRYGPLLNALLGQSSPDNVDQVHRECKTVFNSLQGRKKMDINGICRQELNQLGIAGYLDDPLFTIDQDAQYLNDFPTIENLSPIAFELLDWLGPSPFSDDQFGICSAARLLLGMSLDSIIGRIKGILEHPLAIILDILKENRVCSSANAVIIELVDVFSNADERPFCQFLSENPTNEEFNNRAVSILDNIEKVLTDSSICSNALAAFDMLEDDLAHLTFNSITGLSLSTSEDRMEFCNQVAKSFSVTSGYIPTPYFTSDGQDYSSYPYFNPTPAPGELLPGFYFENALDVAGTFYRSDTMLEGYVVLCTVFERFLKETYPDDADNIDSICSSLRSSKFEELEVECRNLMTTLLYPYYDSNYSPPTSVRFPSTYYWIAIGVEFGRQLFSLGRISQEEVCMALDQFYKSGYNLQSVTRLAVDVTFAEFLPIAHDICNDYDNVLAFFEVRYELWYGGTRVGFRALERDIARVITTHFGYRTREDVCAAIADGIDYASGRTSSDSTTKFEQEVFTFLTDEQRCEASFMAGLDLLRLALGQGNVDDEFELYTGYNSVSDLCSALREYFTTNLCETSASSTLRNHLLTLMTGIVVVVVTMGVVV